MCFHQVFQSGRSKQSPSLLKGCNVPALPPLSAWWASAALTRSHWLRNIPESILLQVEELKEQSVWGWKEIKKFSQGWNPSVDNFPHPLNHFKNVFFLPPNPACRTPAKPGVKDLFCRRQYNYIAVTLINRGYGVPLSDVSCDDISYNLHFPCSNGTIMFLLKKKKLSSLRLLLKILSRTASVYSRSPLKLFLFLLLSAKGNALQICMFKKEKRKKKNLRNQSIFVRKLYCMCEWQDETNSVLMGGMRLKSRFNVVSWREVWIFSLVVIYEKKKSWLVTLRLSERLLKRWETRECSVHISSLQIK